MTAPFKIDHETLVFEHRCQCGRPWCLPLRREWSSPLYVMAMEEEHRKIKDHLSEVYADLMELAGECVEAGVRPSILKRADELKRMLDEWKGWLGD